VSTMRRLHDRQHETLHVLQVALLLPPLSAAPIKAGQRCLGHVRQSSRQKARCRHPGGQCYMAQQVDDEETWATSRTMSTNGQAMFSCAMRSSCCSPFPN